MNGRRAASLSPNVLKKIISKNKINISAEQILDDLLSDYIVAFDRPSIAYQQSSSVSLLFIKECRYYLRSIPENKIPIFINFLNTKIETLEIPHDLCRILSVYFSVYELYRYQVHPLLYEKLTIKDIWNDKLEKSFEVLFKEDIRDLSDQELQQLGLLANWVPETQRLSLSDFFVGLLNDYRSYSNDVRLAGLCLLSQFKQWIILEKREIILSGLLQKITDIQLGEVACYTLVQLSDWNISAKLMDENIKSEPYVVNNIQNILRLVALQELIPVLPKSSYEKTLNMFLFYLRSLSVDEKYYALQALRFAEKIILAQRQDEVLGQVLTCMYDPNVMLSSVACSTFAGLAGLSVDKKYLPTYLMLMQWMIDKTKDTDLRINALSVFKKIQLVLPDFVLDELLENIKTLILDKQEENEIRVLSFQVLAHLYHQCQPEMIENMVSFFMKTIEDKKELFDVRHQAIKSLPLFNHWVYANKVTLYRLLKLANDEESGYQLMMAAYELLSKAKHCLCGDLKIKKSAYFYLLELDNDLPSEQKRIALEVLTYFSDLVNPEMAMMIIDACTLKLNDNDKEISSAACATLNAYKHHLNLDQKRNLLCKLFDKSDLRLVGLFAAIYKEYKDELAVSTLKQFAASKGIAPINDVIPNIMRYSF